MNISKDTNGNYYWLIDEIYYATIKQIDGMYVAEVGERMCHARYEVLKPTLWLDDAMMKVRMHILNQGGN